MIEQYHVIEVDGRFAGFVQACFAYPYYEVIELHLLPEYRSKGIGSDILRYIQGNCIAQDSKIRIGCFKENRRARQIVSELQYRRLWMYYIDGYSTHEIALWEGTSHQAISKSIRAAQKNIFQIAGNRVAKIPQKRR